MIGNDGVYLFDCSIGSTKDFIQIDDQFVFTINEYAGNLLPDFEMVFISANNDLMGLLHEGTLIKSKIGRTYNTLQDMELYVSTWDSAKHGESHRMYRVSGFATKLTYACDYKYSSVVKKSAVEAVLEVAKKNFKVIKSNITKSSDVQTWLQPFQSDKEFIQRTLYRADLGDSFPACAITMDGKFILKDIKADLKNPKPDWKFVRNVQPKNEKEITYVGDATLTSNTGIINKIIGYGFDLKSLILESAESVVSTITGTALLANTKTVGGLEGVNKNKFAGIQQTENVHGNYQKSFYHNLTNLLNLSRLELHFSLDNKYYEIKPLDKCMFTDADIKSSRQSAEHHSGMYYVSFISRTIQARQMMTTLKINRESLNQVK